MAVRRQSGDSVVRRYPRTFRKLFGLNAGAKCLVWFLTCSPQAAFQDESQANRNETNNEIEGTMCVSSRNSGNGTGASRAVRRHQFPSDESGVRSGGRS